LVGAAWGGDPLLDRRHETPSAVAKAVDDSNALLTLAKKQGMNTDVRRSIFVVLMSSDVRSSFPPSFRDWLTWKARTISMPMNGFCN